MRKQKGFTFIELMIAVAVAGILWSIAAGAYDDYREAHRGDKVSNPTIQFEKTK